MDTLANGAIVVHASAVAINGKAALVIGPSGSGKSALCLQLMAAGATLVSDDRTILQIVENTVQARAPETINGMIEARGVGLLNADSCTARVALVIDLEQIETDRLPPRRIYNLLGQKLPLLHKVEAAHFPAAILQYLKGGRSA